MAGNQQSAVVYLRKTWANLVTKMQNFPIIVENLYQRRVFNDYDVKAVKASSTERDKARYILKRVTNQGEWASYELLKILNFTWKRTLLPTLHKWIKRYSFREDSEANYSLVTKTCKDYQAQLKMKAKSILENQRERRSKYLLNKQQEHFDFIPLASEKVTVKEEQSYSSEEEYVEMEEDTYYSSSNEEYVEMEDYTYYSSTPFSLMNYVIETTQYEMKNKTRRYKKLGSYIPNKEETVSPEDLLTMQNKNILLVGKPGIGKTTIAQQMLHLWMEKTVTKPDYMFYFDETIVSQSSNLMNLESLLFDVYVNVKEEEQQEVLQDMKDKAEDVVFILDGVTRLPEDSVLKKIMNHDVLRKAKVIITCRTEMEKDSLFSDWPTKKVYVQGFTEESIRTYYQMMLGHNPDLLNVVLNNQELFSLSYVPMYAFMIANLILFKDNKVLNNPHTVTNMNIHLFFHALMNYGDKNLLEIDEYLKGIKDQLDPLMKNAFSATEQKSLNLPEISRDETNICHAFLKMIPIRDSLTSETKYCAFLHNTMQEFFSALWLVENPDEIEKVLKLCQTEENQHMRRVLPFLCGLLGEHNNKLLICLSSEDQMKKTSECFIEKLLDTFLKPQSEDEDIDLLYVCQCLYELQSSNACLMFLEKMKHQLDIDVNLDPHQSCALSYVISQSRDKEVHLNLQDCTVSDTGMIMILSCSPQIRLKPRNAAFDQIKVLLQFIHKVSVNKTSLEDEKRMRSHCCCNSLHNKTPELGDALLDLYSHVKDYETQTGRSLLPALQSVFQSSPKVWIIDLSKRKTSILLEVLKLQTEKKPVELTGWTDEESEVMSFIQCLPYISQLGFRCSDENTETSAVQFLRSLMVAAESETSTAISSLCSYKTFPFQSSGKVLTEMQCNFLLDLCSHVKDYETQTGRSLLPALQSVYIQSSPDVWIIDLSKRKASILLEVLNLQREEKPVELRGWTDEESEVMSFLQCLPYISQLSFVNRNIHEQTNIFVKLFIKAAETERLTRCDVLKLLTSVWKHSSLFNDNIELCDFLMDLYSHAKDYENQTGKSVLPGLQPVYSQLPTVWIIDLSERKISILLKLLKLQTKKKPVKLRGHSDEESEVMSFLQCLPYISQLRCDYSFKGDATSFVLALFIKAAESETQTGEQMLKQLISVCKYTSFPYETCDNVKQSDFLLDLYSHVKDSENRTGRSLLQGLKSVYIQSSPDVWIIDLSKRKTSILLEVLKLQTEKKPVELRGWTDEESEVMSFLQCLPYISQLSFENRYVRGQTKFLVKLFIKAAETEKLTRDQILKLLPSVWTHSTLFYENTELCDFLLDLYSNAKDYENQTGNSVLPGLDSLYHTVPNVWIIDLSERKASILLEVLKLQTEKKQVKLRGWTDEESEVMSFLQCLPYISQLRFRYLTATHAVKFISKLFIKAAETETQTGDQMLKLLTSVCSYTPFPYETCDNVTQSDFLLDLCSHVKDYETQTGRSLLPALQSIYIQSSPDVWIIDLSKRKTSILLEVLKLQTEKKPVKLKGCPDEESEVMSFLQCLPYISQLRRTLKKIGTTWGFENRYVSGLNKFLVKLFIKAAETEKLTRDQILKLLTSVWSHSTLFNENAELCDFLLDLYSNTKDYENQTGKSVLPGLDSLYHTVPKVWIIDLSERKTSILLEVLKLQTEKKPVVLRGWTDEESEVMSLLQCLPYISQLRFRYLTATHAVKFISKLFIKAAETETQTGDQMLKLLTSVCSYTSFPYETCDNVTQSDFLLDLCSHVKDYETQTGRSLLPALQSIYIQSSPDVWIIDLSKRKTSILLEVLKLQTEKKPVKLKGCPDEESEVMSFLQCLPYISQLRFDIWNRSQAVQCVTKLFIKASETETQTGDQMLKLLTSVCSYPSFPYETCDNVKQSDFLLDLCSNVKDCETQTGRSLLPPLQSVYVQSSPDVWIIDLSERKTSILLEVLKLQTEKKPVELRGWTDEESEVMSFLHCLPYISQLRFDLYYLSHPVQCVSKLFIKAAETETQTEDQMLKLLTSVCSYTSFPYETCDNVKQSDFLLDLYSHVKDYETQIGRSLLPALQSVYTQSSPDVWIIDLSKRKTSILLEVLKLQTEKKPVKLKGCPDEESEVMSFLQCLPYISQLSFVNSDTSEQSKFLLRLFIKAAETKRLTGEQMQKLWTLYWDTSSLTYLNCEQTDFLLDLYSRAKDCETQTGRSLIPALKPVFQSSPDVWIIFLSMRKTSILLEVLKLQTEKKPVKLTGWTDEESELMSVLQCLPYISQLRFDFHSLSHAVQCLSKLFIKAAETETQTEDQMLKQLISVCSYTPFPIEYMNSSEQSDFLLDLYSHVKDYETQTGRSLLPALQSIYIQSSPDVWIIDLSKRKTSILLEVLKLQTEKKPVKLRGWRDEESEVMSFLQCLPFISQLSGAERCVLSLFRLAEFRQNPELVNSLLQTLDFNLRLVGILPSSTCRFVGGVLHLSADKLTLTVRPQAISIRGTRLLFRHITNIQTLRLSGYMVVRTVRALRSARVPVSVNELSVDLNDKRRSDSEMSRVLSSLASLLRLWTVQCLNLSDCRMKSLSLILLLSQQSPVTLRLSKQTLQMLAECVYEAQDEEMTSCFLQKVGRDLTPCALSWETLHYFLQSDVSHVTVDLKESDMSFNIREILPFLNRIHFQQMSSTVMMSLMREIYESRSSRFVSGLLSSVKNCINLQNRALDSVHCAALRFILQHCTTVTLDMLWTSIPEEELKSFLPLLSCVSCLRVDRVLLLKMLRCCSSSDVQQEASAVLLSALQHKLNFSCCSALDLTEDTHTQTLQLTAEDCRVMSSVIQRVYRDTHTLTQLNLHDCQMNTAGIDQLFTILHSVKLQCDKSMLLQFLSHVDDGKAECLSRALGEEVDLSQTHLDLQVCRGLALVLEHSEGLTELDLSQCHLTDQSLDVLLPNLHKAQNMDFSGNSITDAGALKIMSVTRQ